MLLSLHVFSIGTLIIVVGGIAFRLGKNEGVRITKNYYESLGNKNGETRDSKSEKLTNP
ncbi:hypothetical protein WDW89_21710 [Deltaproteobacteria bacterium TL4]